MAVDSKAFQNPLMDTGSFTSASTAVATTETLGYSPSWVLVITDYNGTNPDVHIASAGSTTESIQINGADGVITSPVVASGVDITATGFIVAASIQVDSQLNCWFALR